VKKASLSSCNVLAIRATDRRLWHFDAGDGRIKLSSEQTIPGAQRLPDKLVAKDWRSLWQRKINIAWLPADQIFLRVIHLPAADVSETLSMVELQLEKLSPLPVNQIVWSFEPLPHQTESMQTVVVIIAARALIEQFLGKLESNGYLPDRLELPALHYLPAKIETDGVWVYPSADGGKCQCLVAWWYGGTLQQLQLLHLPESGNRGTLLAEQLTKTAWAGEMEGWLTPPIRCHLVADATTAAAWEPALSQWAGEPVALSAPIDQPALAELSASRVAREETKANLLPAEHVARYHQQWVDRLWMSGLAAVLLVYGAGVLIYFGALQGLKFQHYRLDKQIAGLSANYTNAVKSKARAEVLQSQVNLKFAALDCLKVASELLPANLILTRYTFAKGQKLSLEGTVPSDQVDQLYDYISNLSKAVVNGSLLFKKVEQPRTQLRGTSYGWTFNCDLNYPELE
jgi:type II secretory pathway component PulL